MSMSMSMSMSTLMCIHAMYLHGVGLAQDNTVARGAVSAIGKMGIRVPECAGLVVELVMVDDGR